jgi:hypothetical protein
MIDRLRAVRERALRMSATDPRRRSRARWRLRRKVRTRSPRPEADHVAQSNATYGVFAAVIGLLSWLWLAAQLSLVAGELNVVLARRLWPRSLFGGLAAADQRAMRTAAEAEQCDRCQHIVVSFDPAAERPAQAQRER